MFEEAIVEFEKSLQLALKKLSIMRTKVIEMSDIMLDFKGTTSMLESLYMKDIN